MAVVFTAGAVDLDREGRDPAYVESIVKRSQKIVDKLELTDTVAAREVTTIIANRYFKLNDIYETRDVWGIERSGFFNGREKWAKGFENQRV